MRLVGDRCDSLKFQVKVPVLVYCQNNGAVGDGHDKTVELLRLISIVHCPLQGYFEANLLMWIPAPRIPLKTSRHAWTPAEEVFGALSALAALNFVQVNFGTPPPQFLPAPSSPPRRARQDSTRGGRRRGSSPERISRGRL